MSAFTFTTSKATDFSGWSRRVRIGEKEYSCSVRRGKAVRIPYKPRGQNRGWKWVGSVYRLGDGGGWVWTDDVPGSIGCRGMLIAAGLIEPKAEGSPE